MKIGILTHELKTNYGGILQNYALQQVLIKLGHQPVTLDHKQRDPYTFFVKTVSLIKRALKKLRNRNIPLRGWLTQKEKDLVSIHTNRFIDTYIYKSEPFFDDELKNNLPRDCDAIIVGSDQVWNRNYMKPIQRFFLSDFENIEMKRLAYAASFGGEKWEFTPRETTDCKRLLSKFTAVSVRENTGVTMTKNHLGIDAQLVLDPTLLLQKSDYDLLLKDTPDRTKEKKTMMVYILDKTKSKMDIVYAASQKLGLEIKYIMPTVSIRESNDVEQSVFPPVEEWLKGFRDSEYVITDSFHGTVFSIIYQKPFITLLNKSRGKDRFTSLLNLVGLENRLVSNDYISDLLEEKVDYDRIVGIIDKYRLMSFNYLNKNLS